MQPKKCKQAGRFERSIDDVGRADAATPAREIQVHLLRNACPTAGRAGTSPCRF